MAAQCFLNQSFFIYNHALLKRNGISVRLKNGAATGRAYNNQDGHCLTSQIERIAEKRMDEISREKEEYFADGVLWSDNHSNTSSDRKTVFERIACGSELDLCTNLRPNFNRMQGTFSTTITTHNPPPKRSRQGESIFEGSRVVHECTAFNEFLDCTQQARSR